MTTFDLRTLWLRSGDERVVPVEVELEPLELGGQIYAVDPAPLAAELTVAQVEGGRLVGLRFDVSVSGPCMRCLAAARLPLRVRAREYDDEAPAARGNESTAYVDDDVVDLSQWALDEVALALPEQILCRPDCAGICPTCGKDLNLEPHDHPEDGVDTRWGALAELKDKLA